MRMQGKVAIVTGGSHGIGRATCERFAVEGAAVLVADRDAQAGEACAAGIRSSGGTAWFMAADVSRDDDVAGLVAAALDHAGGLDVLVNNAGVAIAGSVVDTEPARWQRVLDVNLASVYRTCHAAIPHLIARGGGAIVNVASLQGLYGWPGWAAYAASKAGIIGLTRQIAVEYAGQGIRANAVSPGGITTDLGTNTARWEPAFAPAATRQNAARPKQEHSLRGPGRPVDVACAVLFLASDEAAHISGQNLVVDGITSSRVD
jgi:NAD(P)-dependent dehydrogenase (short-subunit alcohol dehydrogenase family)